MASTVGVVASASSPPQAQSLSNVFVYGSLMADEVVQVLLKRVPESSPAILNHYHRFSIKGRVYPAILPIENKKVTGRVCYSNYLVMIATKVLLDISEPELHILDEFEDEEYERSNVEVLLVDKSKNLGVNTYVWVNKDDTRLYGEWDFEEWKRVHMTDFIAMTREFVEELEMPKSKTRVTTYESFYQQDTTKPYMS